VRRPGFPGRAEVVGELEPFATAAAGLRRAWRRPAAIQRRRRGEVLAHRSSARDRYGRSVVVGHAQTFNTALQVLQTGLLRFADRMVRRSDAVGRFGVRDILDTLLDRPLALTQGRSPPLVAVVGQAVCIRCALRTWATKRGDVIVAACRPSMRAAISSPSVDRRHRRERRCATVAGNSLNAMKQNRHRQHQPLEQAFTAHRGSFRAAGAAEAGSCAQRDTD